MTAQPLDLLPLEPSPEPSTSASVARVVASLGEQRAVVEVDGGDLLPARCLVTVSDLAVEQAAASGRKVSIVFDGGDRRQPIIVGFADGAVGDAGAREPSVLAPGVKADVDGKRVHIEAAEEVVLRCGKASITLLRSGRILIRGAQIETHASGTNRIKGAQVRIN
jgi:hypothetical protein